MGEPDVGKLLRRLTVKQFLAWEAFDSVDPIGDIRGDWQAATVCATLMNIAVARSKRRKTFRPKDFLLEWTPEEKPLPRKKWQDLKMIAAMCVATMNDKAPGKGKRHGRRA